MLLIGRVAEKCATRSTSWLPKFSQQFSSYADTPKDVNADDEFRTFELIPKKREIKRMDNTNRIIAPPPRADSMPTDQDWSSVWPGPRTFHPASVPLPVRMGKRRKPHLPEPSKWANAELMKIPNFLHLTPPAVSKHCRALKKFCTKWPAGLETDEECEKHFPLEVITSDYCYSSPTIREPLARIVNFRIKMSSLTLDAHAKDKLLRLLGTRYDPDTDYITIIAEKCPSREQNLDYALYLLTVCYHESWKIEDWEAEKTLADMEYYDWEKHKSRANLVTVRCWPEPPTDTYDYDHIPHVEEFKVAVNELMNDGESLYSLNKYKEAALKVLKLDNIKAKSGV